MNILSEADLQEAMLTSEGRMPSKSQVRVAREVAGLAANHQYLMEELFPSMKEQILRTMRLAKTSEDLWGCFGALRMLDYMVQLVEARTKETRPFAAGTGRR